MKILFEFIGGPRDGAIEIGDTDDQLDSLAGGYYVLSNQGMIGVEFAGFAAAATHAIRKNPQTVTEHSHKWHSYRVANRCLAGDALRIRAEYVGIVR